MSGVFWMAVPDNDRGSDERGLATSQLLCSGGTSYEWLYQELENGYTLRAFLRELSSNFSETKRLIV